MYNDSGKAGLADVRGKSYSELTEKEHSILKRQQKIIVTWSIMASFTYALIWYWVPSVDSFIGKQFALTSFEIGLLISSFGAAFIVTNFMWGHLNDRFHPNRVVTIGLILAGISTFMFQYVTNFPEMIALRVIEGVFNGAAWSGIVKTVQLWFPIEKRSKYLGIFIAVYSWAISLDLLAGIGISLSHGWQSWAFIVGILGVIVGCFTFFMAKPYGPMVGLPNIDWGDVPPSRSMKFLDVGKSLFRYRWMLLSILAGLVVIGGANIISGFYLQQVLPVLQGLAPSQIEVLGTVWGVTQGILILIFGPLSDRIGRRVIFLKIGLAGAAISYSLVALTTFIHPLPLAAIYAVTISTGTPFLIAGPVFALLGDRYGVQMVGAASSYFEGFGTGGGAFLFPLILGFFSITMGWSIIAVIFIAIFLLWLPQKEYRVNRSLVDRNTLIEEKEQKLKEFGME